MKCLSCSICLCIVVVGLSVDGVYAAPVPTQTARPSPPNMTVPLASSPVGGKAGLTVGQLIGDPKSSITNKPQTSQAPAHKMTLLAAAAPASQPALDPRPLNVVQHVTVDPRSGAAVVSLPLLTPAGRNGVGPALALSYSASAGNGPFGWGWGLDLGFIQRSTKKGIPQYTLSDDFQCQLGGKIYELVKVATNEYRARVEGDFLKFSFDGSIWSVQDKRGLKYMFGSRPSSKVESSGKIFKWRLDYVVDVMNNFYVIDYRVDGSFEIRYVQKVNGGVPVNESDPNNFAYVIRSVMETTERADAMTDQRTGIAIPETRRVAFVEVWAAGGRSLLRKYSFVYRYGARTGRTLLNRVLEIASDGVTSRPVLIFEYNDKPEVAYTRSIVSDPLIGNNLWSCQSSNRFDRGHDNFIMAPNKIDIDLGKVYSQSSVSIPGGASWTISPRGNLRIVSPQDNLTMCWTYVYTTSPKTLSVPASGGAWSVFLNEAVDASQNSSRTWNLRAGYNRIIVMAHHQHESFIFNLNYNLADQVELMNSSQVMVPVLSGDFNGDGRADTATFFPESGSLLVALSYGESLGVKTKWIEGFGVNARVLLGDFNGDGRTDVASLSAADGSVRVALSDGVKFSDKGLWLSGFGSDGDVITGDFNADGRTDLLWKRPRSPLAIRAALSTGTVFVPQTEKALSWGDNDYGLFVGDYNGDGLTDLYGFKRLTGDWRVEVNKGETGVSGEVFSAAGWGINKEPTLGDFDQDGRTDLGYFDPLSGKITYRKALTSGFGMDVILPVEFTLKGAGFHLQSADYNGDGFPDFTVYSSEINGRVESLYSLGLKPDLLLSASNIYGGKVSVGYTLSSDLPNKYLPFVIPVVTTLALSNAQGDTYMTQYFYKGGAWDPVEREFMGFSESRTMDALGVASVKEYHQEDIYLRGRVKREALYGREGQLLEETRYAWATGKAAYFPESVKLVMLSRVETLSYDTPTSGRRTAKEFLYEEDNQYGDVTTIRDLGEVDFVSGADVGDDLVTTAISYGYNPRLGLRGFPVNKIVRDVNGKVLAQQWNFYDSMSLRLMPTPPITTQTMVSVLTRGLLTMKMDLNTDSAGNNVWTSTKLVYDNFGNVVTMTDSINASSSITFDSIYALFPVSAKNALSQGASEQYYGVNELTSSGQGLFGQSKVSTDANGKSLNRIYDVWGRSLAVILPLDSAAYPTISFEYHDTNNYLAVAQKKRVNSGTAFTLDAWTYYDGLGRPISSKQTAAAPGKFIVSGHVTYDIRGAIDRTYAPYFSDKGFDVLETTDVARPHASVERDDRGRTVRTIAADGAYTTVAYDSKSTIFIDANGHKTRSAFDVRGRVSMREEYIGADGRDRNYPLEPYVLYASTRYRHDYSGNLVEVEDSQGNITRMSYDKQGHRLALSDPDMGPTAFTNDSLGQVISETNSLGIGTNFTYDLDGKLRSKSIQKETVSGVQYGYDNGPLGRSIGKLMSVAYNNGDSTAFGYDALGRETTSQKVINGNSYNVQRTYDALSHPLTVNYPNPNVSLNYGYNAAGQVVSISKTGTGAVSLVSDVAYDAGGRITRLERGNGVVTMYTYDPLSFRLIKAYSANAKNEILQSDMYEFDAVGNVIKVSDMRTQKSRAFRYDALNRMVSYTDENAIKTDYVYDKIGNLIQKGDLIYSYRENGAGPHAVTSISDGTKFVYDATGRMTLMQTPEKTTFYAYDLSGRLSKVETLDKGAAMRELLAEYMYDGDGGRTSKTVYFKIPVPAPAGSNYNVITYETRSVTTRYVGALYEEAAGVGTSFVFLGGQRVAAFEGTSPKWFLSDHLGSVSVVTDAQGSLKERISYDPWGQVASIDRYGDNAQTAWFYFTGKRMDDETGLYYFGARYYNPKIGRFITPDAVVQDLVNPQTLNRYSYCNNNPVNLLDPAGYSWSWNKFWNGFAGGVVGAAVTVLTGGLGAPLAYALGGMAGGAVTGGLEGGWRGALMGAAMGTAFGGLVGVGTEIWHNFGYLALAGGGGYSIATGNADMFVGGLLGGYAGAGIAAHYIDSWYPINSQKFSYLSGYDDWSGYGIITTKQDLMTYARLNNNVAGASPSRNFVSDFIRAAMQKIFMNSRASQELSWYLEIFHPSSISVHSEGTLTLAGALKQLSVRDVQLSGIRTYWNGPAVTRSTAQNLVNAVGGDWANSVYSLNLADPIGVLTTADPIKISIYGVLGAVTLTTFHSTERYPMMNNPSQN